MHLHTISPKRVRHLHKVRVAKLRAERPSIKEATLVSEHIAVRTVVEHDTHHAEAVVDCRRKFLNPEHEAPVAGDTDNGAIWKGCFDTQCGWIPEAECSLMPRSDKCSR